MLDPLRDDLQRRKDRSTRTLKMVGTCKGSFTKEIKKFSSNAEYFLTKTADVTDDQTSLPVSLINCALAFLDSRDRLIAKVVDLERNLDDLKIQISTFNTDLTDLGATAKRKTYSFECSECEKKIIKEDWITGST